MALCTVSAGQCLSRNTNAKQKTASVVWAGLGAGGAAGGGLGRGVQAKKKILELAQKTTSRGWEFYQVGRAAG